MNQQILGYGLNGKVYKVSINNVMYARKDLTWPEDQNIPYTYIREIAFNKCLYHSAIIPLQKVIYEPCSQPSSPFFGSNELQCKNNVLGLHFPVADGTLSARARCRPLSNREIIQVIYYLLEAVSYLHYNNIVHNDITMHNILYKQDKYYLADLGNSYGYLHRIGSLLGYYGTFSTMAPESILAMPQDYAVDIWSIGVVILSLVLRRELFPGRNAREVWLYICKYIGSPTQDSWPALQDNKIWQSNYAYFSYQKPIIGRLLRKTPAKLCHFIMQCLQFNPADRPNIEILKKHALLCHYGSLQYRNILHERKEHKIYQLSRQCNRQRGRLLRLLHYMANKLGIEYHIMSLTLYCLDNYAQGKLGHYNVTNLFICLYLAEAMIGRNIHHPNNYIDVAIKYSQVDIGTAFEHLLNANGNINMKVWNTDVILVLLALDHSKIRLSIFDYYYYHSKNYSHQIQLLGQKFLLHSLSEIINFAPRDLALAAIICALKRCNMRVRCATETEYARVITCVNNNMT